MFFIAFLVGLVGFVYAMFHVAAFGLAFQYRKQILVAFAIAVIVFNLVEVYYPSP